MKKNILKTGILSVAFLFLLFSGTATASRIQLTLGWHNLANDFYLISEGNSDPYFAVDDKIKGGKLRKSVLGDRGDIDPADLLLNPDFEMWSVDTKWKFDKWINKKGLQALRKAAKKQQKFDNDGKKNGWRRDVYNDWKLKWNTGDREDIWDLYHGFGEGDIGWEEGDTEVIANTYIIDAFEKLEGKKINGRIGDVKFKAYLEIFANPYNPEIKEVPPEINPVPEPATMLLFGLGLLGLAGVSRKKIVR